MFYITVDSKSLSISPRLKISNNLTAHSISLAVYELESYLEENMNAGGGFIIREFLKHAKGKYSKLLCADDIPTEDCIEKLVNYLEYNNDKDFVFGDAEYINTQGKPLHSTVFKSRNGFNINYSENDLLARFFKGISMLPYPCVLVKTEDLKSININNTLIPIFDMTMWVELMLSGRKIGFTEDVVIRYRIHDGQLSGKNNEKIINQYSMYEREVLNKLFLKITNYEQLKAVCKYSPYIDKISQDDVKYFPFVIAHYALLKYGQKWAYIYLNEMLDDDMKLKELKEKFNFGIKEFRKLYSTPLGSANPLNKEAKLINKILLFIRYPKYVLRYYVLRTKMRNKYSL